MAAPKKVEKKPTKYVVLRSDESQGPFTVIGTFITYGQLAAKKEAALTSPDPETSFFVAVPASSFYPQKPVVQMTVTFLADDGNEAEEPEDAEEPEEEEEERPYHPDDDAPLSDDVPPVEDDLTNYGEPED